MDPEAKIYLFGSTAEGKHVLSSDIDVLMITREDPARIHASGIKEPFEIHIQPPEKAYQYPSRVEFVEIGEESDST